MRLWREEAVQPDTNLDLEWACGCRSDPEGEEVRARCDEGGMLVAIGVQSKTASLAIKPKMGFRGPEIDSVRARDVAKLAPRLVP